MANIIFAVYQPPSAELPHLAVILRNHSIVLAEPVQSAEEGEDLLQLMAKELAKEAAKEPDLHTAEVIGLADKTRRSS